MFCRWFSHTKVTLTKVKTCQKNTSAEDITDSRVFTENRALSVSSFYRCVTSCKKSKKSLEPFLRKTPTQPTNQPTTPAGAQLTLRTVTSWNDWLNVSHVISTQWNHHRLHFWPVRELEVVTRVHEEFFSKQVTSWGPATTTYKLTMNKEWIDNICTVTDSQVTLLKI